MNEVLIFPALRAGATEAARSLLKLGGQTRKVNIVSPTGFSVVRIEDSTEETVIHTFEVDGQEFAIV